MTRKQICFFIPYPLNQVPSQRFRFEQYVSQLRQKGFGVVIYPFFTQKAYSWLNQSGNLLPKIYAITISYLRRYLLLFRIRQYDFIFIHREAAPFGPPIIEYIIARVCRKKIVYDFDDAIWLTDRTTESGLLKFIRWRGKVAFICKCSYKVSCGNSYLAAYARQFNPNVCLNPTTIDTENLHIPVRKTPASRITVGWTGSRSTLKYLTAIIPAMSMLQNKYPEIEFMAIADEDPKLSLNNVLFKRWEKDTEIADLALLDIGVMPLPDDPWTRGKCGFKALQYMAMGIPALVSPVGVNTEIVQHGVEGYWCSTEHDWFKYLEELILNPAKRKAMGELGRKKVMQHYSVTSNSANFLSLFQ